jgi:hypothetical protein
MVPVLSQINPVHSIPSYLSKTHLNIILPPGRLKMLTQFWWGNLLEDQHYQITAINNAYLELFTFNFVTKFCSTFYVCVHIQITCLLSGIQKSSRTRNWHDGNNGWAACMLATMPDWYIALLNSSLPVCVYVCFLWACASAQTKSRDFIWD